MQYVFLEGNVFVNALSALFEFIFNNVLSPILTDILTIFVNFFVNIVWNLMAERFLMLFLALCSLVDFVESIFNVFAGLSPVYYKAVGQTAGTKMSLIDVLFQMEAITQAFWVITLASMGICMIFTIYKTAKSIADMTLEDKNPISKVLTDAMKAGITFLMIPFLCVMMLQLSSVTTQQVQSAFSHANGGTGTIGTILFLSATLDADKETMEAKDLLTGVIKVKDGKTHDPSFSKGFRKLYLDGTRKYTDLATVKGDFHPANFSYIVGFISAILILLILLLAIITFVRRLFELLLLYLVAPLFVSTIPLDDGATFARWREMFIAKFFSGFGMIFSMKYYLMLIPFISGSNLVLYSSEDPNGAIINSVLQIFFVIGGAWAVFKAQSLILELLNPEAAQAERQVSALVTGAVMGAASVATGGVGAAFSNVTGAIGGAIGGAASGNSGGGAGGAQKEGASAGGGASGSQDSNQAYRG